MDDRKFSSEEPAAALRQGARITRELFVALVQEGFTEKQALSIVGEVLHASISTTEESR